MDSFTDSQKMAALRWIDRRVMELFPEDDEMQMILVPAVVVHLLEDVVVPMPPHPAPVQEAIERVLTVDMNGVKGVIGTMRGLVAFIEAGPAFGYHEDTPYEVWHCSICRKQYPDDYEPTVCENCGATLIRYHKPEDYPK